MATLQTDRLPGDSRSPVWADPSERTRWLAIPEAATA
jgi:hypothetical protein